jgi:hypothetical protein
MEHKCRGCNKLTSNFDIVDGVPRKTCITCTIKRNEYKKTHKEELKVINREYREKHKEEIKKYKKEYREKKNLIV